MSAASNARTNRREHDAAKLAPALAWVRLLRLPNPRVRLGPSLFAARQLYTGPSQWNRQVPLAMALFQAIWPTRLETDHRLPRQVPRQHRGLGGDRGVNAILLSGGLAAANGERPKLRFRAELRGRAGLSSRAG